MLTKIKPEVLDKECLAIIKENWAKLNELFLGLSADGESLTISPFDFESFCRKNNITDQAFPISTVTIYFKQANVEYIDQANNDDRELCRFEFFELLIRIAIGKYVSSKREKTIVAGFKRLLSKLILPAYEKTPHW